MTPASAGRSEPTVAITDTALARVLRYRAGAPEPERMAMWIEVTGTAGGEYRHTVSLKPVRAAAPGDAVQRQGGLSIVVASGDVDKLRGAVIDWSGDELTGGFVIVNPNKPAPPAPALPSLPMLPMAGPAGRPVASPPIPHGPSGGLSGDVPQRVMTVLDRQVNPAIAAHGGRAELVAVEDGTAFLRLSGGCQGCGMATVTLTQGIEVAIREAVPQITRVIDVTDHASGTNPYFEPAKK